MMRSGKINSKSSAMAVGPVSAGRSHRRTCDHGKATLPFCNPALTEAAGMMSFVSPGSRESSLRTPSGQPDASSTKEITSSLFGPEYAGVGIFGETDRAASAVCPFPFPFPFAWLGAAGAMPGIFIILGGSTRAGAGSGCGADAGGRAIPLCGISAPPVTLRPAPFLPKSPAASSGTS